VRKEGHVIQGPSLTRLLVHAAHSVCQPLGHRKTCFLHNVLDNNSKTQKTKKIFKMPSMHGWKADNAAESISEIAALLSSPKLEAFTTAAKSLSEIASLINSQDSKHP
jgi:hypothetical protein